MCHILILIFNTYIKNYYVSGQENQNQKKMYQNYKILT